MIFVSFTFLSGCDMGKNNWDNRFETAKQSCEAEWWVVEQWYEWWENQNVCNYPDDSFCYLEEVSEGNCGKGDFYYDDDLYPYAEQACIDSNGQISETEEWVAILYT